MKSNSAPTCMTSQVSYSPRDPPQAVVLEEDERAIMALHPVHGAPNTKWPPYMTTTSLKYTPHTKDGTGRATRKALQVMLFHLQLGLSPWLTLHIAACKTLL